MALRAAVAGHRDAFAFAADLEVGDGETLALLGPNGAGKSSVIGVLAGLVPLERGTIELDGRAIEAQPPERRGVGLVPQPALLFPRLSALENVAFGERARGASASDARARAAELLARVAPGIDGGARPSHLSGGQQQRVALARALMTEPRLLLLDEPLVGVDVSARAELRSLLRRTIASFDGSCILVTHEPVDALTMADRVAVIEHGRITHQGTPDEIRRSPRTAYAADLVGVNLFVGRLVPDDPGAGRLETAAGSVSVAWPRGLTRAPYEHAVGTLRPIDVSLHRDRPEGSPRNVVEGPIAEIAVDGERAWVRIEGAPPVTAEVTLGSIERLGLTRGERVFASWKAVEIELMVEGIEPDTLDT